MTKALPVPANYHLFFLLWRVFVRVCVCQSAKQRQTCELLLAAVPDTLLQVLQLVFDFLILPLCLLTLPPAHKHTQFQKNR